MAEYLFILIFDAAHGNSHLLTIAMTGLSLFLCLVVWRLTPRRAVRIAALALAVCLAAAILVLAGLMAAGHELDSGSLVTFLPPCGLAALLFVTLRQPRIVRWRWLAAAVTGRPYRRRGKKNRPKANEAGFEE